MSEATTVEKLEERLKCAICLDSYTDPKLLQCFHVYCRDCLVRLVVRGQQGQLVLTCPTCRQVTPIPANGVNGLQSAFQVQELLEVLEEHKKHKDTVTSQEGAVSDLTHPTSSKKGTPCCSIIGGKELELYCETCGELICSHCALRGQKHHSHKYDLINSCFEKYKGEMTPSLQPVEKQLTTINRALAVLDRHCGEISDQRVAIETDIHHTTQRLHEIIDVRKTELIRQLHQVTQEKLKTLATQRDELETIQVQLKSCLEFVEESLKTNSQEEVLKMKTTIIKQVKGLTAPLQPEILKSKAEADVKFIILSDITAMCRNYGQIDVPGRPDPSQCHATGKGLDVAVVGEKSTAIVQASNFKGEPFKKEMALLQCELVSELTSAVVRGDVSRRGGSQYKIGYRPTIKGRHQLHIKVEDQHIRGSPFSVAVKSPLEKLGPPILTIYGVDMPRGVAINKKGEVMVAESGGHCVSIFTLNGRKCRTFGMQGSAHGQFNEPRGVAVDGEENVLVVDRSNHRIQKFTANGQFLTAVGSCGYGPLQFKFPSGVAWNTYNNKVYVADVINDRIQVLNSDLTISSTFGKNGSGKGQFTYPHGVFCDNSGKVYVADSGNHCIQVFTAEGKFMRMFGKHGHGRGELNFPTSTAIDTNGVVYVCESGNHRISVFTPEGQFVTSFGGEGIDPGKLKDPYGLAVDNSGVVYVCDRGNNRIQLF